MLYCEPMYSDYSLKTMKVRRRRWLETLLTIGFILCLLIGLGALAMLWLRTRPAETPETQSPLQLVNGERVTPGLALRWLGGDAPAALAAQAVRAGELETANALLLFDTQSNSSYRVGVWLQLAQRWTEIGDTQSALEAWRTIQSIAVLDPAFKSLERAQLLVQTSQGFLDANDLAAGRDAVQQVVRCVTQLPDLLPVQRSQLLTSVRPIAVAVDDATLLATLDDFIRNPYVTPGGVLLTDPWPLITSQPPDDVQLDGAIAARQQAARLLADRIVVTGGADIEAERQSLALALMAEEQARATYFSQTLSGGISLQQQLAVLVRQRDWTLLQLQVATNAFGLSIMPQWEASANVLTGQLAASSVNISNVLAALADAQATPLEQALLRTETAHLTALESALGRIPDSDMSALNERIRLAQSAMEQLGSPLALPVAYDSDAVPAGFRIQPR